MGSRVLLLVDALLIVAMAALGVRLSEVWRAERPVPPIEGAAETPTQGRPRPAPRASAARPALASFAVIAEQSLFHPERKEVIEESETSKPSAVPVRSRGQKPLLYGVVLGPEGGSRAFLQDPRTRKIFAYAIGDLVADSEVAEIKADRVVLRQGDELFEVLLRDPSKPKPRPAPVSRARVRSQTPRPPRRGAPAAAVGAAAPQATPRGRPRLPGAPVRPLRPGVPAPPQVPPSQ